MSMRIVFNGQEYSSPEEMPEEVRKAYRAAMAPFADSDGNGVPDIVEAAEDNVVSVQQSSITLKGPFAADGSDLPGSLSWLSRFARHQRQSDQGGEPAPEEQARLLRALDSTQRGLGLLLQVMAAFVAGAVIVGAGWIIDHMSESERSQGGAFYVLLAAIVALAWAAGILINLWRRRD